MPQNFILSFYLLSFLLINTQLFSQGQGNPFMQIYPLQEYGGHAQNWCITTDKRGVIYAGNQDGFVMEFDGNRWQKIPTKNLSAVRSIGIDKNGRIYVGGQNEFGYLEPDKIGQLRYKSLIFLLDTADRYFNDVWSLNILGDKVFFQSRRKIFLYENNRIKQWEFPDTYHRGFVVNGDYYIRPQDKGLMVYKNDSFALVNQGELFANETISAMLAFSEKEIIIGTRTKGLYIFNEHNGTILPFDSEANDFLKEKQIYHGIVFDEERMIFATIREGIAIINKKGKLERIINKRNGLASNTVFFLHTPDHKTLWLTSDIGIARIDISFPMWAWDERYGIEGVIYDIKRFGDHFYVATNQYLYYWKADKKDPTGPGEFVRVEGIIGAVWDLFSYKLPCEKPGMEEYRLIAANRYGMYEIHGTRAKKINDFNSFQMYCPEKDPFHLMLGNENGLSSIRYNFQTKSWGPVEQLASLPGAVLFIDEDKENNIWVSCTFKGFYKISLDYDKVTPVKNRVRKIENFFTLHGLPEDNDPGLKKIRDEILFLTDSGIYRFNEKKQYFYHDTLLNPLIYANSPMGEIYRMTTDPRGNLWIDGNHLLLNQNGSFSYDNFYLKRIESDNIRKTYPEKDGTIWFGGEKLFKLNFCENFKNYDKIHAFVRKVIIKNDSLIFGGTFYNDSNNLCLSQTEKLIPSIDYRFNSVSFEIAAPYYVEQQAVQYQYLLEGFDPSWSAWSKETRVDFTNLPEGKYVFKLRAKNIFQTVSPVASYKFIILPPWYRTWPTYLLYVILLIFFFGLVARLYALKLRNDNQRLEKIISERTAEILEKNKELAKLSIVASETDNSIVMMDAQGNFEWVNNAFTRLYGYTLEEFKTVKGKSIQQSSTNPEIMTILDTCINDKKSMIYQSFQLSKEKKEIWTQTTLTPILDEEGNICRLVIIESDIRKLKEYETEIASQRDALSLAIATKEKFFSIISHDLLSPFSAIIGFSELIGRNISNLNLEKIELYNQQVRMAAKQLYNLLENLLAWSRSKSNEISNNPQKLDMREITDKILEVIKIAALDKKIDLQNSIGPKTFAYADENLVATVLRNLVSNAIKFSPENSFIVISSQLQNGFVEISVKDHGVGISSEDIPKLFREDLQFSSPGTNKEKGTGLGLILCKEFVEKCGGKIRVESQEGKGTTMSFTIPVP